MSEDLQDKTEAATGKKLQDARKKGQVAKSQDLTAAALLITGMSSLAFFGSQLFSSLSTVMIGVFNHLLEPIGTPGSLVFWFRGGLFYVVSIVFPILASLFVASLLINVGQVGFLFSTEPLKPKWKNINIFNPKVYKKFFNTQALARLAFGLCKLGVIAVVCYFMILSAVPQIAQLMHGGSRDFLAFLIWQGFIIGMTISIILLILGLAEFAYQKWKFQSDQKMTKQEVKDERKQVEGDPHQKGKMRGLMHQFSQNRMKDNVPHADVIVANPVHFAIAIKYDPDKMQAPMCVAKGARKMALAIKELASENKVPIVENPLLARGLYQTVEVGQHVPPEFYHAIAEVLAYVYRLDEKMAHKMARG